MMTSEQSGIDAPVGRLLGYSGSGATKMEPPNEHDDRRVSSQRSYVMNTRTKPLDFVARTFAASAAMTASQRVEIRLTHRPDSDLPIRVVEVLTGRTVPPGSRAVVGQLAQATLAALAVGFAKAAQRIPIVPAIALNVLLLVSTNAVVARALGLSDMPWKWSRQDVATDITHKSTLAAAATALSRPRR
jgi:O6-methylguanine-DNA--protein-cysteine methyltransferase